MTTYRPFNTSADHELLEMLDDTDLSSKAFEEFYNRFKDFVLLVCRKACISFDHSSQLADDIFQQTFLKVLHKGYTFRKKTEGKESYTAEIKAWLSRIAKNELIDFLRKNPDEKSLANSNRLRIDEMEHLSSGQEISEDEPLPPTLQQHVLDKALASLSEEEKLVLMTYMLFYNPQTPNNHLPDEIIKNLTERLGVKSGSLRQIKSRALQKMMKIKSQFSNIN